MFTYKVLVPPQDLVTVLEKVPSVTLCEQQCCELRKNLGLPFSPGEGNLKELLEEWYRNTSTLSDLVRALMITQGLGRYVSRLVPYCELFNQSSETGSNIFSAGLSSLPDARMWVKNAGKNWKLLAEYMGYEWREIEEIGRVSTEGKGNQFLRVWGMPHCSGSDVFILEEVMEKAMSYGQSREKENGQVLFTISGL